MPCPYCASPTTRRQSKTTALGYQTFRCGACRRSFNERTGTPFNFLEYPTDIVLLVVLWRLRYKLSLRDLAEMFLERGFEFTHEAVRDWETGIVNLSRFPATVLHKVGNNAVACTTATAVGGLKALFELRKLGTSGEHTRADS